MKKSVDIKILFAKTKFVLSRKIQKLKKIIKRQLYTEIQKQIFNSVNIGEVIYAEMPFKDSKLFEIPEGHRTRPYIVVQKNKKNLICYPASHTPPKRNNPWSVFTLYQSRNETHFRRGIKFKTNPDSFFDLHKMSKIKIDKIISFFMTPAEGDSRRLERQLTVLKNRGINVQLMNIEFKIREGDLLKWDSQSFFIYSAYKNDIYAHPAKRIIDKANKNEYIELKFGNRKIYVKYTEQIKILPTQRKFLIDSISEKAFIFFETEKKRKKSIISGKKPLLDLQYKIGQTFEIPNSKNKFVYLYNIEKDFYGVTTKDIKNNNAKIILLEELEKYRRGEALNKNQLKKLIITLLPTENTVYLRTIAKIAKISLFSFPAGIFLFFMI